MSATAIRMTVRGSPSVGSTLRGDPAPIRLTPRDIECLRWVARGKSSHDIGKILGLSPRTVDDYLLKACAKLGVRGRIQAVFRAVALGILPPSVLDAASEDVVGR